MISVIRNFLFVDALKLPFTNKAISSQLLRFILAGFFNTGVHILAFAAFLEFSFSITASNVLSFLCANIIAFFIASSFVFRAKNKKTTNYLKFLIASLGGIFLSWLIGSMCTYFETPPYFSVLGVIIFNPPISYFLQKIIFSNKGK